MDAVSVSRCLLSVLTLLISVSCAHDARFVADGVELNVGDLSQRVTDLQKDLLNVTTAVHDARQTIRDLTNHLLISNEATKALQSKVASLEVQLHNNVNSHSQSGQGGTTYTRWGHTECTASGTTLVYDGYAGGSNWAEPGAATDYLCLTRHPTWGQYNDSFGIGARLYGAEYVFDNAHWAETSNQFFNQDLSFHDVPCAVCLTQRTATLMIPGRSTCLPGWTEEYHGYLAAGDAVHQAGSQYVCMDHQPLEVPGGAAKALGKLFYLTEAVCGSLKCPPYVSGREITCVVCSQ